MRRVIYIGWDAREAAAFMVARNSIKSRLTFPIHIRGLMLDDLRARGLYWRPTERRGSQLWDTISDAPCSTEFSISRFLVPHVAKGKLRGLHGWALFLDADMMALGNLVRLFETCEADPCKAVFVVKHDHVPDEAEKMDGQIQTRYARKNWSSAMCFNLDHPANDALTPEFVNTAPGRDLHRFCWLADSEIGELAPEWNFLVGHSDPAIQPKIVHHTDGVPTMPGYESEPFADQWRAELAKAVL